MKKTTDDEKLFELADQLSEAKIIGATVHRIATGWWKEGFDEGRKYGNQEAEANNFMTKLALFFFGIMSTLLAQILWTMWG